jgi:hypothetical protein
MSTVTSRCIGRRILKIHTERVREREGEGDLSLPQGEKERGRER